jgi:hypothetical protein
MTLSSERWYCPHFTSESTFRGTNVYMLTMPLPFHSSICSAQIFHTSRTVDPAPTTLLQACSHSHPFSRFHGLSEEYKLDIRNASPSLTALETSNLPIVHSASDRDGENNKKTKLACTSCCKESKMRAEDNARYSMPYQGNRHVR